MPPVAYALASDTAIGVIRSWTIARAREMREDLADDEVTPLAIVGALCLWWLRLVLAPRSTLGGFRRWVIEECPVAPGRTALSAAPATAVLPAAGGLVTAMSHPRSEGGGRRRSRDWDALTEGYRKRLAGAGITRETYEAGASLGAARGHQDGSVS
jgi:hypothetical protein